MGQSGEPLPSARMVSVNVHRAGNETMMEPTLSYMFMQFGQFLAHDFILTKMFEGEITSPLYKKIKFFSCVCVKIYFFFFF